MFTSTLAAPADSTADRTSASTFSFSGQAGVVSSIVTSHLQANGLPFESGYTDAFALLAVIAAVAVVLALLVPTARRRAAHHPEPVLAGASAASGE